MMDRMLISSLRGLKAIVVSSVIVGMLASAGDASARSTKAHHNAAAPSSASDNGAKANAAPAEDEAPADPNRPRLVPKAGPATIDLGHDMTLALPESYIFFDKDQANQLMESMGNMKSDDRIGVITREDASWLISMTYVEEGYVKDDEAEKLDADEILNAIKEGTEEANKFREERGFAAVHVDGWTEPPRYDRSVHHLVWALKANSKNGASLNYNTRILGRRGYASLNLIDDPERVEASKPEAAKFLMATTFNKGARYEDFDQKSDKVAEYGLAALVAGGAGAAALKLVKVGLLAKFGAKLLALLIAGKKVLVVAAIAIAALLKKVLGGAKAKAQASDAPPTDPPAPAV